MTAWSGMFLILCVRYGLFSLQEMFFASYKDVEYGKNAYFIQTDIVDEVMKYEQMVPVTDHYILDG